jgi:hypothetical protein
MPILVIRPVSTNFNNQLQIMELDRSPRKQKLHAAFLRTVVTFSVTLFLFSCSKKDKWVDVDPAFSKYIDAYTTGTISKTSSIRIKLAADANTTHAVGEAVKESLFSISPSVKGKAYWLDARTIEFKPDGWLKPDQMYEVIFKLGKVTKTTDKFSEFKFSMKTVKPSFKVEHDGLRSNGVKNKMSLSGDLETADIEDGKEVEKLLSATHNNNALKISWQHNDAAKTHRYTIENISRAKSVTNAMLMWDGKPMSMDVKGETVVAVPAKGDFKVLDVVAINDAQQYASVQFSDMIAVGQDLEGLISISGQSDISYTINGSEVKVFGDGRLDGNYTVNINAGIKNTWGDVLDKGFAANINFENRMPSVKIHGKGNILPNSGRLVLPFESINLNAVDISIIKIFEENVPQFLQENSLGGNSELRRVGKPIVQKTLRLDDDKTLDLHKRQHFSLDIDKYLKTEQGAIYKVTIGFRPEYSLYLSADTTANTNDDDEEDYYGGYDDYSNNNGVDEDDAFWDRYDTYYPFGYSWSRRNDPTSKSYYNKDRWATRNILASNIGLTAKRGNDNSLLVAVNSILTTEPMDGVDIEVMDYQRTIISKGKSSGDGFTNIDLKRKPFLLIAKKGKRSCSPRSSARRRRT